MTSVAKLLFPEAKLRLNTRALNEALTFAFASGATGEALDKIMNAATPGPSLWNEDCFGPDLFLEDFVKRCLGITIDGQPRKFHRGHLKEVLTHSPSNVATTRHRQRVLAELSTPSRSAPPLRTHVAHHRGAQASVDLGGALQAHGHHPSPDGHLASNQGSFDQLAASFDTSTSGLATLNDFGEEVLASEGYKHLQDLLDYEAHLATVDVRLRLGFDGQLRGFEIVRATENSNNPFYSSPLSRFWSKLRMLLRGYRAREREILGRLLYAVFDGVQRYLVSLFQIQLDLEVFLASLDFRDAAERKGLAVCLPTFADTAGLRVEALFNPFLLDEEPAPVPCDLNAAPGSIVVITGPNSGGKTRLLQALGLCQVLAQAGLYVPAASATLSYTEGLFVSLIHEAHANAKEGRLGTELLRIRRLFEKLSVGSLVLLDELCSGTNPSEGEAIFELVVSLLAEVQPLAFISTHFLQFAGRLAQESTTKTLAFLQAGLDEQLEPTYKFVPGVASTSLAQKTAERLGVTREALHKLVLQHQQEYATRHPGQPEEQRTHASSDDLLRATASKENSADSSQ